MSKPRQLGLALERGFRWMLHIDSDEVRAWLEGQIGCTCIDIFPLGDGRSRSLSDGRR